MFNTLKLVSIALCLVAQVALATEPPVPNTLSAEVTEPSPYAPSIIAGLKSFNDSGRAVEYDKANGRTFKGKQEIYAGIKTKSGWGTFVQMVQTAQDTKQTDAKWVLGDPSLTIVHPAVYDSPNLRVWGQFRQYFPASDFAQKYNQYQSAYYSFLVYHINESDAVFNQLTPRYFFQSKYDAFNTKLYFEDRTVFTHKINPWLRVGAGHWTQLEQHEATPTGLVSEVFPMADIIVNKNLYFGPRLMLPVVSKNSVYDGPKAVALDNAMLEIYLEATL
jgi:hypothetical protein